MGAFYFFQSPVFIDLIPQAPSIIILSGGGEFSFTAQVQNRLSLRNFILDVWCEVVIPGGNVVSPLILRRNVLIRANSNLTRQVTQYVPGNAPYGNYDYFGKIGLYPDSVVHQDSFPFTKLAGDSPPVHNQGWNVYGWDDDKELRIENSKLIIFNSYPNPFNASTALSYKLQAASKVKLAVYDIAGREVAVLADGFYPSGTHQAVWEASSMASGVYFARLQADGVIQTRKLLLVK